MIKRLLYLVALLCVIAHVSAECAPFKTISATPNSGVTSFSFSNSLSGVTVNTVYVSSTTSDVSVDVCVDGAPTTSDYVFNLNQAGTTMTLSASNKPGSTIDPNSASQTAPVNTLLAVALGLLFVFRPTNKLSVIAILAVLGLVYAHAATAVTVTVTIAVPDSILTICEGTTCSSRDAGPVTSYVNVYGAKYATLDTLYDGKCVQSTVMTLPANWKIATASDALVAIAFNDWKTDGLVLADGSVYANRQYNVKTGSNGLVKTGSNYQVAKCDTKILIVQQFPTKNSNPVVVSPASISNYVSLNGYDYAVLDNTAYNATTIGAQKGGLTIDSSSKWEVAPEEDSTTLFIQTGSNIFGCDCVVLKTGNAFFANNSACGKDALLSVTHANEVVYGVSASGNFRVLIRRANSASTPSWATKSVISYFHFQTDSHSTKYAYASLDNTDPYDTTASGCQSRYMSVPAGWSLATDAQMYEFLSNNKPDHGNVFLKSTCWLGASGAGQDRDLQPCAATLLKKTFNGDDYYTTQGCGKILVLRTSVAKTDFSIGMKVLLITENSFDAAANDIAALSLAKTMFAATGIPSDILSLTDADGDVAYPASLPLYDTATGNPKYYAIVMTSLHPLIRSGTSNVDALSAEQTAQLKGYRFEHSVRMVSLNDFNAANTQGVGNGGSTNTPATGVLVLDSAFVANAAYTPYLNGINTAAKFEVNNQFYVKATLPATGVAVARMCDSATAANTQSTCGIVAAIITNDDDKTQELQFYTGNAEYLDHGPVLANMWISWVTRNMWVGNRRIYFSPQIDDLYLATEQYNNEARAVRMTGDDMDKTVDFLTALNASVPSGSRVTLTYGANCAEANNYHMVNGVDDLVEATKRHANYFFWESHTWSHLNLDCNPEKEDQKAPDCHNTTFDETWGELTQNDAVLEEIFKDYGGLAFENYSNNSMITPAITGLFNPEALRALFLNGKTCVVGDNSRPVELVPENPYLGMFTTKDRNGHDGVFIIPRYATEVYFNSADPSVLLREYNDRYAPTGSKPFFDRNSTIDDIMAREGENNFRHLAVFRHDPYMFHQCNLFHFPYTYNAPGQTEKPWSFVTLWLQTVVDRYNLMLKFPLLGVKQQDLRDVYFARREREFCGLDATLNVAAGNAANVKMTSTGACTASITGFTDCTGLGSSCRVEPYAGDSTVWAPITSGAALNVKAAGTWKN